MGGPPPTQKKMPAAAAAALGSGDGTGYVDDDEDCYGDEYDDSEESYGGGEIHQAHAKGNIDIPEAIKYKEAGEADDYEDEQQKDDPVQDL